MKPVLSFAFVFVLLAGNAFGATITMSGSAPATNVEISQLGHSSDSDLVWRSDAYQFFGQTFTVTGGGFTLDKVSFKVTQENDPPDRSTGGLTMQVNVFSVNSLNDQTGTTVFGSLQTGVTPNFPYGEAQWMTLDVDDVQLNAGLYGMTIDYAFLQNATGALPGGHKIGGSGAGILFNTSESYVDGRAFRNTTALDADNDLAFVIQSVPEPTGIMLAGLGCAGLTIAFRRRRN